MRFCFVLLPTEYYSPVSGGAISTVTMHVVRELEQLGHDVLIIAPEDNQPEHLVGTVIHVRCNFKNRVDRIVSHLEARLRGWDCLEFGKFWRKVRQELTLFQPDVVVLANDLAASVEVRKALPDVTLVVWLHNEFRARDTIKVTLQLVDVFLTCSNYIRNWVIREYNVNPERVITAHAGVDKTQFYPSFSRQTKKLKMIYVGRLDPNKGVETAVEVTRCLLNRSMPVSLTVAGHAWFYRQNNSNDEDFVRGLRCSMGVSHIEWLGHVSRRWIPALMREHDIALVLSRSNEPFGLVVLEAMASGLAVMASSRGGLPEACGEAGIFVDPDDGTAIAQQLESLCVDRQNLYKWQVRSLQRAAQASWRATTLALLRAVGAPNAEWSDEAVE